MHINLKKPWINKSYKRSDNPDINRDPKHHMIMDVQREMTGVVETESGNLVFDQGIATLPADSRAEDIYAELQEKHAIHPQHFALLKDRERHNDSRTHRYFQGGLPGRGRGSRKWKKIRIGVWKLKGD